MGEAALVSHMSGKKHRDAVARRQGLSITAFLAPSAGASWQSASSQAEPPQRNPCPQTAVAEGKDVLQAKIYWTLNIVSKHQSFTSSEKSGNMFRAMFPDINGKWQIISMFYEPQSSFGSGKVVLVWKKSGKSLG